MIITRKIQIFICEDDAELRKSYYDKLYKCARIAAQVANFDSSTLFALDNKLSFLSKEDRERIVYLGCEKNGVRNVATKRNALYVASVDVFKDGDIPSNMLSCIAQNVRKCYEADKKKGFWRQSLRSYKSDMPMPMQPEKFRKMKLDVYTNSNGKTQQTCSFELMKIPFMMRFGRDRSGNRELVARMLNGEIKMCTSAISIEKNKTFLLLSVDVSKHIRTIDMEKTLNAYLGIDTPIICALAQVTDLENAKVWNIGSYEEFRAKRLGIQGAVRRCQISMRDAKGGRGRAKKCKAINRFHDAERNLVDTMLHTYSRRLVDLAVKHECGKLRLCKQTEREASAKLDKINLRNWSYYGLIEKIKYKAEREGITLEIE